ILWQGKTGADGLAAIGDSFGEPHNADGCWSDRMVPLLVFAQCDADFAFTLSSWNQGITPDRFGLNTGGEWDADIYHTVLDRALFREDSVKAKSASHCANTSSGTMRSDQQPS